MQVDVSGRVFHTESESYVSLPLVNKAANRGKPSQPLCTEMIHWDDFRKERNIDGDKPSMQQLFDADGGSGDVTQNTFSVGNDSYCSRVVGVTASQAGAATQAFCSEMLHWDDYCAQRSIQTGAPSMAEQFRPFESKEFIVFDLKDQKMKFYTGNSVALIAYGATRQVYCSEMEHWDDVVKAKTGQAPIPSMASLFRS